MTKEELKQTNDYIEIYINRRMEYESRKAEMLVIKIFRIMVPIFTLTPVLYLAYEYFSGKGVNSFYFILLISQVFVMIYHHIIYGVLRNGANSYFIKFLNVTIEISTVSFVILMLYKIYNATIILSGPLVMVYMVMIIMTGFRYSFRISLFSGIMAATQHFLMYVFIINEVPDWVLFRMSTFGVTGIALKSLFLVMCGVISGLLAVNAKDLIRKIAIKAYETNQIKTTFGQYVSKEIRDFILSGNIDINGEEKRGVILFADIKDFTNMLYKRDPKLVILQLNDYFSEMVKIIADNNGVVNKFVGDAIMAVFGLSGNIEQSEYLAVKAATEMHDKLDELNKIWDSKNYHKLDIGVGIAAGNFLTGNIGCDDRKEFTCIGDVVNTASRLESLSRKINKKIIISEEVKCNVRECESSIFSYIGDVDLKGKVNKVKTFFVDIDEFKRPREALLEDLDVIQDNLLN